MTAPDAPLDPAEVRPDVSDVSVLLRTRTVGMTSGLGGDTGPGDATVFNETTRPTATECESVIDVASDEVLGQLPRTIDPSYFGSIKRIIAARAAVLIEVSFFRDTTNVEPITAAHLAELRALQAVLPGDPTGLVASGLSERELALVGSVVTSG